jgi:hypothetical protein
VRTQGTYTGTSSGEATLAGTLTIDATSLINTTTHVGTVTGNLHVDVPNTGNDVSASFTGVYYNGTVVGLATGHAGGSAFVGNVSASFDGAAGFSNGLIGGAAGGYAVEISQGGCRPTQPKPDKINVHGTVSSVSGGTITAAGVTCTTTDPRLIGALSHVQPGDRVELQCTVSGSTNTLTNISGERNLGHNH